MLFQLSGTALAYTWTDKPDYSPGETVTIHGDNSDGAGYLADEPIFVEVWGPNGFHVSSEPDNPTADANGAWSWQLTLWDTEAAVGDYTYTATGLTSNVSQSGTFTDALFIPNRATSIGPKRGDLRLDHHGDAILQRCTTDGHAPGILCRAGCSVSASCTDPWVTPELDRLRNPHRC